MEGDFEVEKIVSKRLRNGGIQYRLKWVGFSSKENSWVSIEYMKCPRLIYEFEMENVAAIISECNFLNAIS